MNELERFLNELDRLIYAERESEQLQKLEEDVYARADALVKELTASFGEHARYGLIDELQALILRLRELERRLAILRNLRYKKICEAARLRPNSDVIRAHLVSWERELYDALSRIVEKHFGGMVNE